MFSHKLKSKLVGRAFRYIVNRPTAAEKEKKKVKKRPARMYVDVLPFLVIEGIENCKFIEIILEFLFGKSGDHIRWPRQIMIEPSDEKMALLGSSMSSPILAGRAELRPMGVYILSLTMRGTIHWYHFLCLLCNTPRSWLLTRDSVASSDLSCGVSLVGFGQGKGFFLSKLRVSLLRVDRQAFIWPKNQNRTLRVVKEFLHLLRFNSLNFTSR